MNKGNLFISYEVYGIIRGAIEAGDCGRCGYLDTHAGESFAPGVRVYPTLVPVIARLLQNLSCSLIGGP
jgi:hypothetical protein